MFFNFLLVGTLLSVPTVTVATPATGLPADGFYRWKVRDWNAGCLMAGGCQYDFTIEGDAFDGVNTKIPPFFAVCNATGPVWAPKTDGPYAPCVVQDNANGSKSIAAKLLSAPPDDRANLQFRVSYQFKDEANVFWNYTSAGGEGPIDSDNPNRSFNIDNIDTGVKVAG